jgi:hypothetical protein
MGLGRLVCRPLLVFILTPYCCLSLHVEQAKVIRLQQSHRPGPQAGILLIPGIFLQELIGPTVVAAGHGPRPAGILSFRLRRRIDAVCRRFEHAWKAAASASQRPRIEEYLDDTPERTALLQELIALHLRYPCPLPCSPRSSVPNLGWGQAAKVVVSFNNTISAVGIKKVSDLVGP